MSLFGPDRLIKDLQEAGLSVSGPASSGGYDFVVVQNYSINKGRFSGEVIDIALQAPSDYPITAPSGLFVSKKLIPAGLLNVHDWSHMTNSLPSADWLYWSRPLPANMWKQSQGGTLLKAHWNRVFSDERLKSV